MTYLIVSPAYAPFSGVGANRMMSFTQYLVSKKQNVIVLRNAPETWPPETLRSNPPEGVIIKDVIVTEDFDYCVKAYQDAINRVYEEFTVDRAVYSGNPYYPMVAAANFRNEKGFHFVIDFRDLWVNDEQFSRNIIKRLIKRISRSKFRRYEKYCVRAADYIVTVTPRECEALRRQYPKYASKMGVIYNGFDESRLEKTLGADEQSKVADILKRVEGAYTIGIFGKLGFYDYDYVEELFKAVITLNTRIGPVKLVHIGEVDRNARKAMEKLSFPQDYFVATGYLDYNTGIELLKRMTANGLIVHYKRGLGTKLFDYIYVDKPIIYFAQNDSSIADLLKEFDNSYICTNENDVVNSITTIIDQKLDYLGCHDKYRYSRKIQNQAYEDLLDKLYCGGMNHE